jgi:hypothetical protein
MTGLVPFDLRPIVQAFFNMGLDVSTPAKAGSSPIDVPKAPCPYKRSQSGLAFASSQVMYEWNAAASASTPGLAVVDEIRCDKVGHCRFKKLRGQ